MADINDLKQKRFKLIKDARSILDEAEKREDPSMTDEDNTKYKKIMDDVGKLTDQIVKEEEIRELEKLEAEKRNDPIKPDGQKPPNGGEKRDIEIPEEFRASPEMREFFEKYGTQEYRDFFHRYISGRATISEVRALQVDSDTAGGYIQPPVQFVNELIKSKDNLVFMRRLCRTFTVPSAESLGAPSLDNDPADPAWVSELSIGSFDSTMSFGKRELNPHPLAQGIKVSNKMLRATNPTELVNQRLSYKQSVVEENAFLNGSGSQQPLGIFTASNDGVSTSRDVSTGNTTTGIRTDNLLTCKYTLPQQYRSNCIWIFHRSAVLQIALLKDGEGRYIWQPSLTAGTPDRLLNYPVYESEYAPSTFTTGLYVGILFDPMFYWIADALSMTIQKLVELYAGSNQTGFLIRSETDGMPVHENAYVRVKLA